MWKKFGSRSTFTAKAASRPPAIARVSASTLLKAVNHTAFPRLCHLHGGDTTRVFSIRAPSCTSPSARRLQVFRPPVSCSVCDRGTHRPTSCSTRRSTLPLAVQNRTAHCASLADGNPGRQHRPFFLCVYVDHHLK